MSNVAAWGTPSPSSVLAPLAITRRDLRDDDVAIIIHYCGVCHSDLHTARNDWGHTRYPVVPGHEIVGLVSAVGSGVTDFQPGDRVAVGCMVDSCLACESCVNGEEQYCHEGMTGTYSGRDRRDNSLTQGGYSQSIVVRREFVLRMPDGLDMAQAAPLLCAGITTWSPLRHWKVGAGMKVAVVGLGGLGHMGVKFAVALGAQVTVITTSPEKGADAVRLGAKAVLVSTDREAMKAAARSFDFILDTAPVRHPLNPYLALLRSGAALVLVGAIEPLEFHGGAVMNRRTISGSGIGGIRETQEMLDFCARENILPDCEMIRMDQINEAYERIERGDVKYRFVIDIANTLSA